MLKRYSHVGIVVHDLDAAVAHWTGKLGLAVVAAFDVPEEGVRSVMLAAIEDGGSPRIELVQPLDPRDLSHAIARRLAAHGEGVFHLAFEVDPDQALQVSEESALELIPLSAAPPRNGWRSVLHPKHANGVLIEMIETSPTIAPGR